jgi:hypothetical protein
MKNWRGSFERFSGGNALLRLHPRSGHGASESNPRRMAITTSRIRVFESTRLSRSSSPRLGKVWMKCPCQLEDDGRFQLCS